MLSSKERVNYLLQLWSSGHITPPEEQELLDLTSTDEHKETVEDYIELLVRDNDRNSLAPSVDWKEMYARILEGREDAPVPSTVGRKLPWFWWAAAAATLIMLGAALYLFIPKKSPDNTIATQTVIPPKNDVSAPASSKATLTLSNGTIIDLNNVDNGSLAMAGAENASKQDDGLQYADSKSTVAEWHTLANPRGSKPIHLQLADGSEVWLNAASSVTFPTIFTENDRKVNITGEAYFEVAKSTGKRFIVSANGTTTEVLGTHFNINAYDNESVIKITLLEGSVKTSRHNGSVMLRPAQQANYYSDDHVNVLNNVDVNEVVAWKDNMFEFNDSDIRSIMRQIERWYDVDVVFNANISLKFNGTIERQVNISKLLDMLEKTGGVRFAIEEKKVIVKGF